MAEPNQSSKPESDRGFVESVVEDRAAHHDPEDVRTTSSFANAERLFGQEYHGRFLIELLQNAADAWGDRVKDGKRSRLEVMIGEGPALLVANQGDPFPAATVIESLGHIGRSPKVEGQSIGHKGIGFKSVLEISSAPEIYSGLSSGKPSLAVRFDPRAALETIRARSPNWDDLAADDVRVMGENELGVVPILRFPVWAESLPAEVEELADRGFDTVVRVPFRDDLRPHPELDEEKWFSVVRDAIEGVSDEMLLLLGAFDEVVLDDRPGGQRMSIQPDWDAPYELPDSTTREQVLVTRDGARSSCWLLFRRSLPDREGLAGEILAGMRLDGEQGGQVVAPRERQPSAPFYLFFPTKISSGLPLLLHGYFEVNAARTGFYDGAATRNEAVLRELAQLIRTAVADAASSGWVELASLVNLLGEAGAHPPEDKLASRFCDEALDLLDDITWVPVEAESPMAAFGRPTAVLVDEDSPVIEKIRATFPAAYVRKETDLGMPSSSIGESGHRFLVSRRPEDALSLWEIVSRLCRPGPEGPWPEGEEQIGFLALIELFAALSVNDRPQAEALLDELRGDESSVLVPVSAGGGRVQLLPLPDPREGVAGRRSRGIMARTGARAASLVPPASLDLAFVPDGLLSSETEVDQAKPLGIRPFTVANILDRLVGVTDHETEPGELANFLWRLLTRETLSEFSVQNAWERAREFSPSEWFWCQAPPTMTGPDRERQRRRQSLASVHLPARDGSWHPAGTLAFGSDWADWLATTHPASSALEERQTAYVALEEVSPDPVSMLASPEKLRDFLGSVPMPRTADGSEADPSTWLHAFLLALGVWETLPIDGFDDGGITNRARLPWEDKPFHRVRDELIKPDERWAFGLEDWGGDRHTNPWVAQDFRFQWSLGGCANRNVRQLSWLLGTASPLYERLLGLTMFCPNCSGGGGRHVARRWSSAADGCPSLLALELRTGDWVAAVRDGKQVNASSAPADVWWASSIPSGAALTQSPLRFLALSDPAAGINSRLRELAGIHSLADADVASIMRLLEGLRVGFGQADLQPDPRASIGARRAFVGLHRQAYERLFDLSTPDEGRDDRPDGLAVLCDIGDALEYRPPMEAFHNDGAFASYRRYFSGRIAFVELAKEKGSVAAFLGVQRFEVDLKRRESDMPEDVTDELNDMLADRLPEFLAILVHHVLAGQTLDPTGPDFEARAQRLLRLRVYRVEDLVIEARVTGTDVSTVIGEGSDQELFLDGATTPEPTIYHDLSGDNWQEPFRRKLGSEIARILERPDYADIFTLFLLDDTDAQREATLLERDITSADVDAIRAAIGIASEGERRLHRRWFGAIAAVLTGSNALTDWSEATPIEVLTGAGLSHNDAARMIEYGGGEQARQDTVPGGALEFLRNRGVDLQTLDKLLRAGGDEGLHVRVARLLLREWSAQNGRAVVAVLATRLDGDTAKKTLAAWKQPAGLEYELDPSPDEWLAPVLDSLRSAGFDPRGVELASNPTDELLRLSQIESRDQLEALTQTLYDAEERSRILSGGAAAWRSELRLLGILSRTSPVEGRATIRLQAEAVDGMLPLNASSPVELRPSLPDLLPGHESLQTVLHERLTDSVSARGPDRVALLALAEEQGLATAHAAAVVTALQEPRRELARQVRENISAMDDQGLRVAVPEGLGRPVARRGRSSKRRTIKAVKVSRSTDNRKRQLGEQGEQWALAAIISGLIEMPSAQRNAAIDELLELLDGFQGPPVEAARAHAEAARSPDLDEEELVDELAGFLHVANRSDEFGFDLLGWIAVSESQEARAMAVEVKSSADGTFHLSQNEWKRAEELEDLYSVLIVRRTPSGGVPRRLDLLNDPVALVSDDRLARSPDGWILGYASR